MKNLTKCAEVKSCGTQITEKKALPSALEIVGDDGVFEGYACLFGKEDLGHDVIQPGAFAKSLAQHGLEGIKLLYQHDPTQPIGQWLTIREDDKGLFVRGKLATEVAKAREILSMMKAGILDGLSIGFRTIRGQKDAKSGIRYLLELDLWEISVVTFPMQPDARISSVKSGEGMLAALMPEDPPFSKRELERKLMQDAGLSRSQARALMAHGLSGLGGMQDAAFLEPSSAIASLHTMTRAMLRAAKHQA
nr:HK97 family phage prohead protease [uncultured Cohaesibacter sp.]